MASLEGLSLFLKETDAADRRLKEAMRMARDAEREQFDRTLSLAQMGLTTRVDQQGNTVIDKLSPQENVVFQAQAQNMREMALMQQGLKGTLEKMKLGQSVDLAQSPEFQLLENLKAERERQKTLQDAQNRFDAEVAAKESESGQKLTKFELQEIREKTKAQVGGRIEAQQPQVEEEKLAEIQSQRKSLEFVKSINPDAPVDTLMSQLDSGATVDNALISRLQGEAIRERERTFRIKELKEDAKKLGVAIPDEIRSPDIVSALISAQMKKGEGPSELPKVELDAFNRDAERVAIAFEEFRTIQNFFNEIRSGEGFITDTDVPVPQILKELIPELKDVDVLDAGDENQLKLVKEIRDRKGSEWQAAGDNILSRSGRDPLFKSRVDDLAKRGIIQKAK